MELKDKIIEVSFQLFSRVGIRSISMDDIAQHLGISKKTIYKWYENKDAIVKAGLENYLAGTENQCNHMAANAANAIDELFQTIAMLRQMFSDMYPTVIYDLQKFHPGAWKLVEDHKSKFLLSKITDNMHRGIKEGLYRADLDIEVAARLRLATIGIVFDTTIFPPEKFELQRVQEVSLELYMMSMATLKGHKLINKYKHVTEEE